MSILIASNELRIIIQDNVKGFDYENEIGTSKSLGLRTMYERIANVGGKLWVKKGTPKGTRIEIHFPVQAVYLL